MTTRMRAYLALEDGMVFEGWSCGASGEATGELCFNTSMTGYQEIVTDPSYAGQIITMTMPQIGNYGVNPEDSESRGIFARGMVVREMCFEPSNWRSTSSLPDFLKKHNVVAIEGVDTRQIVRHLRERGALRCVISTLDADYDSLVAKAQSAPTLVGQDLVATVAYPAKYTFDEDRPEDLCCAETGERRIEPSYRVVAFDSGVKYNILRCLSELGCHVTVVPATTSAAEVLALKPDGIFLANGPGDPDAVDYLYQTVKELIGKKPLFGICLGHQMLSLAIGAQTYKLKYGHRGGNHPVRNMLTGRVEITSQNHGFCVDFASMGALSAESLHVPAINADDLGAWVEAGIAPVIDSQNFGRVQLTHINLNDMTVEGIRLLDYSAFSVQYHPEAAPGPHDAHYLFGEFVAMMEEAQQAHKREAGDEQ